MASKKKSIMKVETLEERRQRELKEIMGRIEFCPEPTYVFNIGDMVEIGNLEDVRVIEILEDGKIYEIDFTSTDHNYGNPIKSKHCKRFVCWYQIRPYKENNNDDSLIKNREIRISFMQMNLQSLLSKTYYFGVNFNPDYQRDFVWGEEDKVALIDSIFNNVDIGKFAFISKDYSEKYSYEILDGKQRLRAILDYYENKFPYKGKYFNDLTKGDKNYFNDYPVSIAEKEDGDKKSVLKYFIKLNKHGKIMSKEQIEKVEKMLEELES